MLAFLAIVLLPGAPRSEIARLRFADAVRESDRIVRAEVVRIHEVPVEPAAAEDEELHLPLRVAELRVLETLKGREAPEPLLVLASGTWQCDATSAEVGERGLFLLREQGGAHPSRLAAWSLACELEFPGAKVERIVGSGQGKLVEVRREGRLLLEGRGIDVPADLKALREGWRVLAEPEELVRFVRETIAKQRRPLLTAERLARARNESRWRFVLARDRTATLTLDDVTRELRIGSMRSLERALLQAPPPASGASLMLAADRDADVRLVLHARDGDRELLVQFRRGAPPPDVPDAIYVDALWTALAGELSALPAASELARLRTRTRR